MLFRVQAGTSESFDAPLIVKLTILKSRSAMSVSAPEFSMYGVVERVQQLQLKRPRISAFGAGGKCRCNVDKFNLIP